MRNMGKIGLAQELLNSEQSMFLPWGRREMRTMSKRLAAAVGFATLMATGQAGAVVIDPTSYAAAGCLGATSCAIGGATLSALGPSATFDEQDFAGQKGLGISSDITSGQARDLEIQGDSGSQEGVEIDFADPQIVTKIQLAHFYNPDAFASDPQEIAIITGDGLSGTLQVLDNAGNFILTGDLIGATPSLVDAGKGLWQLLNPFGSNAISALTLKAADTPKGADNSDYSIALVETSDVPEPTTLGLLGAGLIGIGVAARRARRSLSKVGKRWGKT